MRFQGPSSPAVSAAWYELSFVDVNHRPALVYLLRLKTNFPLTRGGESPVRLWRSHPATVDNQADVIKSFGEMGLQSFPSEGCLLTVA